jgi:hypothetical protein
VVFGLNLVSHTDRFVRLPFYVSRRRLPEVKEKSISEQAKMHMEEQVGPPNSGARCEGICLSGPVSDPIGGRGP